MHTLVLCTCLASFAAGQADPRPPEGLWELTYYQGLREGNYLATHWIIDFRTSGGKLHGRVVATSPALRGSELDQAHWEKGRLRLKFTPNADDKKARSRSALGFEFDGVPGAGPDDGVPGMLRQGGEVYTARLLPTKQTAIENKFGGRRPFAPMQEAWTTLGELRQIRDIVSPDKVKRAAAVRASYEVLDRTIPHLEQALKDPDRGAVVEAAKFLVRQGVARKQPADRLTPWARAGERAARHYGPHFHAECAAQLAAMMPPTAETAPLILELIQAAEKSLAETHPFDLHCRVLWVKDAALRAAGDRKASEQLDATWRKLEKRIQDLHHQQRPLPKLAKVDGRAPDNERRAVVELVETSRLVDSYLIPAQAAFDGLAATFGDRVILYEYGWFPEGMLPPARNPGARAAEGFHARLSLEKKWGTYPVRVNNQLATKLKVARLSAQELYDGLHAEVAPVLGKAAAVKLSATATRRGDKVEVRAQVADLPGPGGMTVLLAEGWSYYAWPSLVFSQKRAVRAVQYAKAEGKAEHRFEFDLAKLERDLAPIVEGLSAVEVLNPYGAFYESRNLVRARRWHEPCVIVTVWAAGELQQAVQVKVSGF